LKRVVRGRADVRDVLDLNGFELDDAIRADRHFLTAHPHDHRDDIASFVWRSEVAIDLSKLEEFLGVAIERYGDDLLRYKGVLHVAGRENRIVLQGVQRMIGCDEGRRWEDAEPRGSVIVFIGRDLPQATLFKGLALCADGAGQDPVSVLRDAA
jgi:G3E family GTPase